MSLWRPTPDGFERIRAIESARFVEEDVVGVALAAGPTARGALRQMVRWDWTHDRPVNSLWSRPVESADHEGELLRLFELAPGELYLAEHRMGASRSIEYFEASGGEPARVAARDASSRVWARAGGDDALGEAIDEWRWTRAWAIATSSTLPEPRERVLDALAQTLRELEPIRMEGSASQVARAERLRDAGLAILRRALRTVLDSPESPERDEHRFAMLTSAFNLLRVDRARTLYRIRHTIELTELRALVWDLADTGRRLPEIERRVRRVDPDALPEL